MRDVIHIDESRLNFPLKTVTAGVLSSAYFTLEGVPPHVESLAVCFGYDTDGLTFRAECAKADGAEGVWTCYANPYVFPAAAPDGTLEYHVLAVDGHGNPQWLGTGVLRVLECPAEGSADAPTVIPRDTYIRNPVTGLYHLLTAIVDDDGNMTLDLAEEGVAK